jgi:hypothetical protein
MINLYLLVGGAIGDQSEKWGKVDIYCSPNEGQAQDIETIDPHPVTYMLPVQAASFGAFRTRSTNEDPLNMSDPAIPPLECTLLAKDFPLAHFLDACSDQRDLQFRLYRFREKHPGGADKQGLHNHFVIAGTKGKVTSCTVVPSGGDTPDVASDDFVVVSLKATRYELTDVDNEAVAQFTHEHPQLSDRDKFPEGVPWLHGKPPAPACSVNLSDE